MCYVDLGRCWRCDVMGLGAAIRPGGELIFDPVQSLRRGALNELRDPTITLREKAAVWLAPLNTSDNPAGSDFKVNWEVFG